MLLSSALLSSPLLSSPRFVSPALELASDRIMVQRPRPMIRKLMEPVHVGNWAFGHADVVAQSPLERNRLSPKGWKNRESDGIGLGIVAALEKTGGEGSRKLVVGAPAVILSPRTRATRGWVVDEDELGSAGSVWCTGGSDHGAKGGEDLRWREMGHFCGSTRRVLDLSYCYLCRKGLHGKDIYMYRGEKAFCSMECRYRQIVSDEYQEKCGSEASKQSDVASSTYSGGQLFFTGIAAA